jgi:hypothetical protein
MACPYKAVICIYNIFLKAVSNRTVRLGKIIQPKQSPFAGLCQLGEVDVLSLRDVK